MKRPIRAVTALAVTATAALPALIVLAPSGAQAKPFDTRHLPKIQQRLMLAGPIAQLIAPGNGGELEEKNADTIVTNPPRNYYPAATDGCKVVRSGNIKVNQNCVNLTDGDLQGRGQSQNETSIAADPFASGHVVASFNDYRRGDGNCYAAYSKNGGRAWEDSTVPMSFTRGTNFNDNSRQYWQGGGDTSVAWDTKGNAYLSCQVFNRGAAVSQNVDESSAFYVFRSTQNNGASWNFPGRPVAESYNPDGQGVISLEDKQLLTVDNHVGSPYQDRVYVSWTEFASNGTAYIYSAYSKDYAETFSKKVLVSRGSAMCTQTYGLPTPRGACNENQFSQPFTGSDGALYVTYANFNNTPSRGDNRNQMMLARSTDGGQSFSNPVKVGDYYDLPDCLTYQGLNPGRACVPEKSATTKSVFRAINYPVGAVDPKNPAKVVVTYGSYINRHSKESNGCIPTSFSPLTGINRYRGVKKVGACNNDILLSVSRNGGRSFDGAAADPRNQPVVTTTAAQHTTDQWFQWADFSRTTGDFGVSYYDRQYGKAEMTGNSDFSLSGSTSLAAFASRRVSSSSMPPPTQFDGVFWGDYTGLTFDGAVAVPLWSDSRDLERFLCPGTGTPGHAPRVCVGRETNGLLANDQNAYAARVPLTTR